VTVDLALAPILSALLGSVRILVMMSVGPLFSHPAVGMRFRIIASLLVAWVAAPTAVGRLSGTDWDVPSLAASALVEVAIGLAVGIGASLVFAAMMQLGEFLAVQGGIGAAQTLDPATGASSPAVGLALQAFALLIFLAIDGHHDLLRAIAATFRVLPVGGGFPSSDVFLETARLAGSVWSISVQIAAPVTVVILVENVATGVLGRALPQLNILVVNLPLHVCLVLLVLGLGASELVDAMKDHIEFWPETVFEVVAGGAHGR
jgi:flagellar biosynthetic protein FliR